MTILWRRQYRKSFADTPYRICRWYFVLQIRGILGRRLAFPVAMGQRNHFGGNASYQMVKFKEIADQKRDEVTNNKDENQLLQAQKFYGTFCSLIKLSEAYYIAAECLGTTGSEVYDRRLHGPI